MSDFVLTAPAPVAAVSADAAAGLVPIDDAARMVLDEKVDILLGSSLTPASLEKSGHRVVNRCACRSRLSKREP